ncbi:MAG TPA: SAM-dependent methyltransferase [Caulobacterales bacterium]|nr:SAM-dependent methyltransferase [Caulobacterales bacterium]
MARRFREEGELTALPRRLQQRIRAGGPISVADYMAEVAASYYGARDPFGAAGDFITAPEVSQIFGELLGLWCAELWQRLGAPDPVLLVELGPGRGTLMADALRAARVVPGFDRALRLHLVETSAALRRKQAEKLSAFKPHWHDSIATLPPGPMLLVANEFLDALPIQQFERRDKSWHERRIGLAEDGESFVFVAAPTPSAALQLPEAPAGTIAEIAPAAAALGVALGTRLAGEGGAALFIDYGHVKSTYGDTLQALRRHRPVPVLEAPGSADLTAHVDFAAFAAAARAGGAAVFGPATQRDFLLRLGRETRKAKLLERATPDQASAIVSGAARLIEAEQRGSLFKVLALGQKGAPAPSGFEGETP